ncbi:MAG TPA: GMC oxidoreductase, partial [Streptosporangiaceae bacterium]|nr:GMC oxidoreductase [Streptosporangiaceae bacterium]
MGRAFWSPGNGLYGMFDVWDFGGLDSVVSSGLGGGSLIYANVLLRKDERWFVHEEMPGGGYESWPVTREDLDPHYDEVEKMIGVSPYPLDKPAYEDTPKTHAMQDAAAELGLDWRLPPLAVSFSPNTGAEPGLGLPIVDAPYGNLHKVGRKTCRLCGECDIGCNDGAKNTLDHTYLSAAQHHGADLRTLHEVKAIRPRPGGGYEVDYRHHDPAGSATDSTIGCDRLVLGAGTYGTSYLLLRSKAAFPGLSEALGTRFSGNGDLLTFLLNAQNRGRTRPLDASKGPVITSAIRLPDELDGVPGAGRGAYIEDGGYPAFTEWIIQGADVQGEITRAARFVWERFRDFVAHAPDTNLSKELADLIGDGALSVSSLPLLGMGRDVPDGVLRLRHDRLDVQWTTETSERLFERLRATMQRMAAVLGAHYQDNPLWFSKKVISVHPLGGAPMGLSVNEGVCDAYGEVFGYPGLYIADGAAMPGPVGANPSLTIAALADRMCTRLLEAPQAVRPRTSGAVNGTAHTSLSFTEEMKGYCSATTEDPVQGENAADREKFMFRLTITAEDVDRFLAEPGHLARADGWIDAASHGGRRQIERGWFNLFAPAGAPDRRLMKYRLYFTDGDGRPRTLVGQKNVFHGPATDIWPDTSTLYFRVLEGHLVEDQDEHSPVTGAGVLHILPADFAHQMTTFRTTGPHGLSALARFGAFFAGRLWDVYKPSHL